MLWNKKHVFLDARRSTAFKGCIKPKPKWALKTIHGNEILPPLQAVSFVSDFKGTSNSPLEVIKILCNNSTSLVTLYIRHRDWDSQKAAWIEKYAADGRENTQKYSFSPTQLLPKWGYLGRKLQLGKSRAGDQIGYPFSRVRGFSEWSWLLQPFPVPSQTLWGGNVGIAQLQFGYASVLCCKTPEMQCGGQVFLFILLLSFLWDGKPLQRPQQAAQTVSEVNNWRETHLLLLILLLK